MGKVNVYLPDDLERAVREAGLSLSAICQTALREALDRLDVLRSEGRGTFTARLDEVLDGARQAAADARREVAPEDLFGAIVEHGENLGARTLSMLGVDLPAPRPRRPAGGATGELSASARDVLASALRISLEMRHPHIGTEHVVIALASPDSPVAPVFAALGIEPAAVRRQVDRLIANPWTAERSQPRSDLLTLEQLDAVVRELAAEVAQLKRGSN